MWFCVKKKEKKQTPDGAVNTEVNGFSVSKINQLCFCTFINVKMMALEIITTNNLDFKKSVHRCTKHDMFKA